MAERPAALLLLAVAAAAAVGAPALAAPGEGGRYVYRVYYKAVGGGQSVECRLELVVEVVEAGEGWVRVRYSVPEGASCEGGEAAGYLSLVLDYLEGLRGEVRLEAAGRVDPLDPPFYVDVERAGRVFEGTLDLGTEARVEYKVVYDDDGFLEEQRVKLESGELVEEVVVVRMSGPGVLSVIAGAAGRLVAPLAAVAVFAAALALYARVLARR